MRKLRISRRVLAFLLILVLVAVIALEVYAHTYVPHLSVTSEERALAYMWWGNGTQIFHREFGQCSVDWLFAWAFKKPTPSINAFYIYIFKVNSSGSLLVQDLEIIPLLEHRLLKLQTTSNGMDREGAVVALLDGVGYEGNYTGIRIRYDIGYVGVYDVTFNLSTKVYAKTLVGYLPIEDTTISINVTMTYEP